MELWGMYLVPAWLCLPAISMILRSAKTAYTTQLVHVTIRIYIYSSHSRHQAPFLRSPLDGLISFGHFRESTMPIIVLPADWRVEVFIALSSRTIPLI